jgi:hypothetical protein
MSKRCLIDATEIARVFKQWMKKADSLTEYNIIKACLEQVHNAPKKQEEEFNWHDGHEIKCDDKHLVVAEYLNWDNKSYVGFADFYSEEDYRNNWNSEYCVKEYDRVGWYVEDPTCGLPIWNITKWMLIPDPDYEGETKNE